MYKTINNKRRRKMKKILALVIATILIVAAFSACGGKTTPSPTTPPATSAPTSAPTQAPAAGAVKTGLAVITSAGKSADAGDSDGVAQVDSTVVAVTVDDQGVIKNCVIDQAQTKMSFSKDGRFLTPLDTVFVGKQELGEDYGMKKASKIGKEWNEQADAFAKYVIGKTVEQVKGIAVTEAGAPKDADLAASVTVSIGDFVAAIEKAVANARHLGASAGDRLGLGLVTTVDKSKDAGEAEGVAQAYTNYAAVTFDDKGVITSCIIDASQTDIKFSKEGKITTNLSGEFKTKNELGDDYGMKKASIIGKEWYEQAAAFASYVVGKTVDQVKGIALTEGGEPSGADLKASVTISVGPFIENVVRAYENAK